jgi:hypothetical protein
MPSRFYGLTPNPSNPHSGDQAFTRRPEATVLVFCEGYDEFHLLNALLDQLGADPDQVALFRLDGNGDIKPKTIVKYIPGEMLSQFKSFFLLRDAETLHFDSAVQSCRGIASAFGFKTSDYSEARRPQYIDDDNRKFGFYISPDHSSSGALDTLLLSSFISEPSFGCLSPFFACVLSGGSATSPIDLDKRKLRTYLAASRAKFSVGVAINSGDLDISNSVFDDLRNHVASIL